MMRLNLCDGTAAQNVRRLSEAVAEAVLLGAYDHERGLKLRDKTTAEVVKAICVNWRALHMSVIRRAYNAGWSTIDAGDG